MTAIVAGAGLGLENSSARTLGGRGILGSAAQGRSGDLVYANAATGNLVIQKRDELLIGRGPDAEAVRTYNSLGQFTDDNGDNWRMSAQRSVALSGTRNTAGSTVTLTGWDGSLTVFNYDTASGKYVSTAGDGAYDTIEWKSAQTTVGPITIPAESWIWTDGSTRIKDAFGGADGKIFKTFDPDGNALSYAYGANGLVSRITTANAIGESERTDYVYSGTNLTRIETSYVDAQGVARTHTRVSYEYTSNRLTKVTVDLTPENGSDNATYVTNYEYDAAGRVSAIWQTDGSRLEITYDASNRVILLVQTVNGSDTRTTQLEYFADRTEVTDPRNYILPVAQRKKTILYYDGAKQLTRIVAPPAQSGAAAQDVQFRYDAAGNPTRMIDAIGGETNYLYDANGNVRSVSDPTGRTIERFYDANNQLIRETELVVDYIRLGASSLTSSSAGSSAAVSNLNPLWTVADGVAQSTLPSTGDFAGLGPKNVVTAEVGRTYRISVEFKVDGAYQFDSTLGPPINLGARMLNSSYAELRHVVKSATAQDLGAGWVKLELEVTALAGETYIRPFVYRRTSLTGTGTLEFRNLTIDSDQTAQSFHHTRHVYDGESHLRYAISAEGRVTEYRYWDTGEHSATIEYPEHAFAIGSSIPTLGDMNAWRDGLADRSSTKMQYHYHDARGNLIQALRYGAATAAGAPIGSEGYRHIAFVYDQAGQLLSRTTAPQLAETFVYDGMGRVILSTDLAGGTTSVIFQDASTTTIVKMAVSYNATTQTWDETASSYVTTSVYNKAGDLISTTDAGSTLGGNYTNGGTQTYLYDKNGRLRKTTDATGYKSYFLYDKVGRKVAEIGHDGQLVEYRYDEAGRLAATARYTIRLTADQLATLDNPLIEVELGASGSAFPRPAAHIYDIWQWSVYDAGGRVIETIEGDGSVTHYEYDQADRLVKTTGFVNKLTSTQITAFMTAAPTARVLPAAHADDRIIRTFYDRDGRLIGSLNGEGHLSQCLYDSAGQKIREIAYANATQASLRASGTFDQLLASITQDAAKDISTRYVYDGQGLLRFTIDALSRVTENIYWTFNEWNANGLVRKSVAYAAPLGALANYSYASVEAAVAALPSASNDRATYFFYNDRAQLVYSVDATGAVTGLAYDVAGRVVKATQYATRIADMTAVPLDHPWWMDSWASNPANAANARITRNYYAERGDLRFVVDAEGYVTRNDYDKEGRLYTEYRYATKLTVDDSWTVDTVNAANKGAAVARQFRYDTMGRLQDVYDGNGVRRFIGYYANGMQAWEIVSLGQGTDESRIQYIYDQAGKKIIERRMTSETQNATSQGAFDTLLNNWERLVSPNGQYSALLTREGELRVYHKGEFIWTNGVRETVAGATYRLVAQTDGNLVVHRDVNGQYSGSIWQSNTYGVYTGPTFLEMQNDGNLVYKKGTDPANQTGSLWSTGTTGVVASDPNASEYVDTTFAYDGLGNLISVKDARNNTTTFTHDKVGRVLTQTNPLSGATQFQYDAFGRGVKTIDARGNASYVYFDQAGRVKLAIDAENYATRTTYTAFSEIKEVTRYYNRATSVGNLAVEPGVAAHALDATTKFEYDKLGRVAKTIDAERDAQGQDVYEQYTLNAFGERTKVRNRLGGETNYEYDKRGLLTKETLPISSVWFDDEGEQQGAAPIVNRFEYDSRGNRTKTIEASGLAEQRTTVYEYDAADRLVRKIGDTVNVYSSSTAGASSVAPTERYFYDRRGNLIEKRVAVGTPAEARTLFWYDKLNRVTHQLSATGTLTRYFYDKNGNIVEQRTYATQIALPGDASGLPPAGSGSYRVTQFEYDALNRLTKTKTPDIQIANYTSADGFYAAVQTLTTVYQYDSMGNVVLVTDAKGRKTYSYYDKLGRKLTQIDAENYRTDWTYNADGNVISEWRFSARSVVPTGVTVTPPTAPAITGDDRVTNFTYDTMGRRLTEKRLDVLVHDGSGSAVRWSSTVSYTYNALGQVLTKTEAPALPSVTPWWGNVQPSYGQTGQGEDALFLHAQTPMTHPDWVGYQYGGSVLVTSGDRADGKYTVRPGEVVKYSFETKEISDTALRTDAAIAFWDANGNFIAHAGSSWTQANDGRFVRAEGQATAPANAAYATLEIWLIRENTSNSAPIDIAIRNLNFDNSGVVNPNGVGKSLGDTIKYTYDQGGRLTHEQRSAYVDAFGASVNPTIEYSYNGLNDLSFVRKMGSAGAQERTTRYVYGTGGRLDVLVDAEHRTREYRYDAAGRVVREEYYRTTPTGSVHEAAGYDYALEGRVTQQGLLAESGGAWSYAGADVAMMRYNAFGEVSERGMNGSYAERFDYDNAGRLWRTTSGDGTWKYFMYDHVGNQTLAVTSSGADLANYSINGILYLWGVSGANPGVGFVNGVTATITRYDGRNQAVQVIEPQRELKAGDPRVTLSTSRDYSAFGEVVAETNALGHTINYTYNTMGRLIRTESPQVSITLENGTVQNVRPTEHRYYDAAGRLVASRDANGNLTRMTLLAGTGYGGSQALATEVKTADNATVRTAYDIHGEAIKITDQIGRVTTQNFDRMGRLVRLERPGGLVEEYQYDNLGQRIRHWNSHYGNALETNVERILYDRQGRITQHYAMGGDLTSYSYVWDAGIETKGLAEGTAKFGGWTQTTTYANGKVLTEKTDLFGRAVWKSDLGSPARITEFRYDKTGRLTHRDGGVPVNYEYLNTGRVAFVFTMTGTVESDNWDKRSTTYTYDEVGNVKAERLVDEGVYIDGNEEIGWFPVPYSYVLSNSTASYDALGRLTSWSAAAAASPIGFATPAATITYEYDANGNIRRSRSTFSPLNAQGTPQASTTQDYWYRYDALNRVVTSKGKLENGQIVANGIGINIAYDLAGQRAFTLTSVLATHYAQGEFVPEEGGPGYYEQIPYTYTTQHREDYEYDADGRLKKVRVGDTVYDDRGTPYNGADDIVTHPSSATTVRRAEFQYDSMGRLTHQWDFLADGSTALFDRAVIYNSKSQILTDETFTTRGSTLYRALSSYTYGAGASYALGAAVSVTAQNWEKVGTGNWNAKPTSRTDNTYEWWDGAVQNTISFKPDVSQGTTNVSSYSHQNVGGQAQLLSVYVADGRTRHMHFLNDMTGQGIRRDEIDSLYPTAQNQNLNGDPHEIWYRFNGKLMGYVGNNGTLDTDYVSSISNRTASSGTGAFRNGMSFASPYADFDQSITPFNSYYQGSSFGSYTVRGGDTLASIAAQLWGDSSLWYKLAEANGLTGQATLIEGQVLNIPAGVVKSTHNASTFTPYDSSDVIGDTAPTTPKQPKGKKNKCGVFGQILLVVIAVVISVVSYGALTELGWGMVAAGATAGAAGSVASQAVGVATGIQEKFSWNAVALAAIGGAVGAGGGVGSAFGSKVVGAMVNSAITQGIGVLTGLQDKFSWAGVAAAGVAAGVGHALGGDKLRPLYGENASRSLGNIAAHAGVASARAVASAATRSLIDGSDFGDNMLAALPDVIGQTIGESIAGAFAGGGQDSRQAMLHEASHSSNDRDALKVTPPVVFDEIALDVPPLTDMAELTPAVTFSLTGDLEGASIPWPLRDAIVRTDFRPFANGVPRRGVPDSGDVLKHSETYPMLDLGVMLLDEGSLSDEAVFGGVELTFIQAGRNNAARVPSLFTVLDDLDIDPRGGSDLLDHLESIAREYGQRMDQETRETGLVWEYGGLIGYYQDTPVILNPFRSRVPGSIDLDGIERWLRRNYPDFRSVYDYHLHTSPGIPTPDGPTGYGFSHMDAYWSGGSARAGSFLLNPDKIIYATNAELDAATASRYRFDGHTLRQWRIGR